MPTDKHANIAGKLLEVQQTLGWMDLVIGNISDAVYVTNGEGIIVFANQFFANVVGVQRVFLLGEKLDDVFPAVLKDVPISEYVTPDDLSLLPGNKHSGIYEWTNTNNRQYIFRISSRLLGTTNQTVYLAQNITREYQMSKMKSSFIDLASHQLRTPMTAIMTYANMLHDGFGGELTADQQKLSGTILQSSERMIKLVNDLLAITRLQNNTSGRDYTYTTVGQLFQKLNTELGHRMQAKKLRFSCVAIPTTQELQVNESVLHGYPQVRTGVGCF